MATVGIIVIGDEILKGFTQDTNSHFICKELRDIGVKVRKVSIIADSVNEIASEVSLFSKKFTFVITTGGIGPTHDDLTYAGVCAAFNDQLEINEEVMKLVETYLEQLITTSGKNSEIEEKVKIGKKMADLPSTCKLHYSDGIGDKKLLFPLVSVQNVYIFPGIPALLERGFNNIRGIFCQPSNQKPYLKVLYVRDDEWSITQKLNCTVEKFSKSVTIGSYPDLFNPYYKVKITLESLSSDVIEEAAIYFKSLLPDETLVNLEESSVTKSMEYVYGLLNENFILNKPNKIFKTQLSNSLHILEQCLDKFNQKEVVISFNGGKDCTALLHLYAAVLQKKVDASELDRISILYVHESNSFSEVEKFLGETIERYNLKIIKYKGVNIKTALEKLKLEHGHVKAILMGTRASDPYSSNLKPFDNTDSDWPQFTRVLPMLDWNYHDVWTFLRALCLPYCFLYDKGYTSLGHEGNTKRNRHLEYIDNQGNTKYKPAYELSDVSTERNGRNS
ncbi:FAD synthase [Nymphon striatum]|nr:FAD synthase [Nymphon striatum]